MSTFKVFIDFYHELVVTLPMTDAKFTAQLVSCKLLPGDLSNQVKSQATPSDKASHFLDHAIREPVRIGDNESFNELLNVMEHSDYSSVKNLAKKIRNKLQEGPVNTKNTAVPPTKKVKQSTALEDAAENLRATYETQSSLAQDDWPNCRITKYVRLALVEKPDKTCRADHERHIEILGLSDGVDKIQDKKGHLNFDNLSEMFCNSKDRLILIMGGPGTGKTTLVSEICVKWAREDFLSKAFHIVILLLLRSIRQQSTEQVFEELIGKDAFQQLKESRGTKCLIILDGLDEITLEHQQSDNMLTKLINSRILQYSTIVATSRPHACQELMRKANKIIEILGFGHKELTEFVQDSFPDQLESSEEFLQKLEEHPQLYSLCHVPLSLAMIIDIFKEKKTLPSTLTKLYYQFMVMMLTRESKKVKEKSVTAVTNNVEEIPHQTLPDVPKDKLGSICLLSELAFYGFFETSENNIITKRNQKIIFDHNDLIKCGIVNTNNYDGHSLLKMETLHNFAGGQVTFNFIHLTLQEFLCAVYMLTLSQEEQYHLLNKYFDDYPNIMILYCGLTKLDYHKVIYSKLTSHHSTVTAVKCLYEGQLNTPPKSLSPFELDMSGITLLPYDCHCLSYVCYHYPVTQLDLHNCHIGVKQVMKIVTSSPSLRVLDVGMNDIGDDGISLCLQYINTLTELRVEDCGLSAKGATYIKKMLMVNRTLKHLNISDNKIQDDGVRDILEGLQQNDTLTELWLGNCKISVKGATYIKKMLMVNKYLEHLKIDGNNIGDDGTKDVMEGIQYNGSLTELRLRYCKISVKGATYIKKMLMVNRTLKHLDISSNKIQDDGVRDIMEGLQQNDTLAELVLYYCEISVKGAISISEMIKINHTLQLFDISRNPIGDEGIAAIATNLNYSKISKLYLWRCNITVTGAKALAECLVNNHNIKSLVVFDNAITVNGLIVILEAAVANKVCEEVVIDDKYDSDDKVKEMMSILEERKRQEESKIKSKDGHVTMPTEDHHGNSSVKEDVINQ